MSRIPKRCSLMAQAADILREDLRTHKWRGQLPGEHFLCNHLAVSRNTLRAALDVLRREGLVEASQGRRRRITARVQRITRVTKSNLVAWLSTEPMRVLSSSIFFYIDELRHYLQNAGYELWLCERPLFQHHHERALESMVRQTNAACWILILSTAEIQRWFWERKIPSIVLGFPHQGIRLPSIDIDYRAVCRHAVGVFMNLGHRRLALLIPKTPWAGEFATEQSFRQAFQSGRHANAAPLVVYHDASAAGVRKALDSLFHSPQPPTGILVVNVRHMLTVITYLMSKGIRIPEEVSIISRNYDWFLDDIYPRVAHYRFDSNLFARRLARLVVQLATTGLLPARPTWIMPTFRRGDTLAPTHP